MHPFTQRLHRVAILSFRGARGNIVPLQIRTSVGARNIHSSPLFRAVTRYTERQSLQNAWRASRRRYANTSQRTAVPAASEPHLSLSARLRKLSREYGWSAVGIYMALSALDFPFCFLAVRQLGTERIGQWEHAIVQWVRRAIPVQWPKKWGGPDPALAEPEADGAGVAIVATTYDHGVREAEAANSGETASIWTQLALAYAIHKSFIFLRVPLTAAVTPKVVKTLRGWGWNIGKLTPKAEREAARAAKAQQQMSGAGAATKASPGAAKRVDP